MTTEEERRKAQEMLEEARRKIRAQQEARAREAEEQKRREEMDRRLAEARARAQAQASKFLAEHTVQPGDTLSGIAKKYYGDAGKWPKIYEANKEVIGDNPDLIRPGQVLKIPRLDA